MRASRRLLMLAACTLFSGQVTRGGESFDRLGRLMGFGWSDGYHACGADCYRLGENLPPNSYASQHSLHTVSQRHSIPRPSLASKLTYCDEADYDRSLLPPSTNSPIALPMIGESERGDANLGEFDSTLIPADPYTPTEPTPLPPIKKPSPERMPTPAEPLPAPKEAGPAMPDAPDSELPPPKVDEDPEELPAPRVEPTSPSDVEVLPDATAVPEIDEVRNSAPGTGMELELTAANGDEGASRPKRIGTKYPTRLPSINR